VPLLRSQLLKAEKLDQIFSNKAPYFEGMPKAYGR
jgi:hypothetical protein